MDSLTLFGLFAVTAMMLCYALESRSHWFVLAFAEPACLHQPMGSCKARGRLALLKGFGRLWRYSVGGHGRRGLQKS